MSKTFFQDIHMIDPAPGRDEVSTMLVENGVISAV